MTLEIRSIVYIPEGLELRIETEIGISGEPGQSRFDLYFVPLDSMQGKDALLTGLVVSALALEELDIDAICASIAESADRESDEDSLTQMSRLSLFEFDADEFVLSRTVSSELRQVVDASNVESPAVHVCEERTVVLDTRPDHSVGVVSLCDGHREISRYILDVYSLDQLRPIVEASPGKWVTLPKSALISSPDRSSALRSLMGKEWTDLTNADNWRLAWQLLAWHGWPIGPCPEPSLPGASQ